jgi:hypothetical protein
MARIQLSSQDSVYIADRIATFAEDYPELTQHTNAIELNALPLYFDWTGAIGIRPDGAIVDWDYDNLSAGAREVTDPLWVHTALVSGAKRYPLLQHLIPARQVDAVTCDACGGLGYLPKWPNVVCWCGGLGWLDAHTKK